MSNTDNEVLQFVIDNDVKFIRLAFCDVYGHAEEHLHHGRGAAPRL